MASTNTLFVRQEAEKYDISPDTVIYKYLARKTKASERSSKARRSLGNLYALYVLCDDLAKGNQEGSSFTELMARMKGMPFGSKLQNHPLDNRLNDEVRRQYGVGDEMLPVQPAHLQSGKKARKISLELLSEGGMEPVNTAQYVVASIDRYIQIISDNQTEYLNSIESSGTHAELLEVVREAFLPNADARLFEIISFAILHLHFKQTEVLIEIDGKQTREKLCLFRTGRTNANDGGIDFVLKPLGKFFQVTENLDFRKYFLDFDKINRFPISFVIKTDMNSEQAREAISTSARRDFDEDVANRYLDLFEEIYTSSNLNEYLDWISGSDELVAELKEIIILSFKLEYGLLD